MLQRTITPDDCEEIQDRRSSGERPADIAEDFPVGTATISRHANGRCNCEEIRNIENICPDIQDHWYGNTPEEIKDKLELSLSLSEIKKHGKGECDCIFRRSQKVTPEQCEIIRERINGEESQDIAEDFPVAPRTVRRHGNGKCDCSSS